MLNFCCKKGSPGVFCSDLSVATGAAWADSSQLLEDRTGLPTPVCGSQGQGYIKPPSLPPSLPPSQEMFYDNSRNKTEASHHNDLVIKYLLSEKYQI